MMGDKRIRNSKRPAPATSSPSIGLKRHVHGQHPVRPGQPDRPGIDPVPEAGHRVGADVLDKTLDAGKLGEALSRLVRDDPTLKTHTDEETKDIILSGMGELHLEISIEKLKRTIGVPQDDPSSSARQAARRLPAVAWPGTVDFEYKFAKQTGGRGKFAVIHVQVHAADAG